MASQKILNQNEAEQLALAALGHLASDEDRLYGFFEQTGLRPDTLRQASSSPGFLTAVLDYIASDDSLVLDVARGLAIRPERIMEARERLSPSEPTD